MGGWVDNPEKMPTRTKGGGKGLCGEGDWPGRGGRRSRRRFSQPSTLVHRRNLICKSTYKSSTSFVSVLRALEASKTRQEDQTVPTPLISRAHRSRMSGGERRRGRRYTRRCTWKSANERPQRNRQPRDMAVCRTGNTCAGIRLLPISRRRAWKE